MGQALVAASLPGQDLVQKASSVPRGSGTRGESLQWPAESRCLMRPAERNKEMDTMAVPLVGRAPEQLVFGDVASGAGDGSGQAYRCRRALEQGRDARAGCVQARRAVLSGRRVPGTAVPAVSRADGLRNRRDSTPSRQGRAGREPQVPDRKLGAAHARCRAPAGRGGPCRGETQSGVGRGMRPYAVDER